MLKLYRHIDRGWQFSNQQKKALKRYYDASSMLVNYLNSYCDVTKKVR